MIQDILGQPQPGLIGGVPDLRAVIATVDGERNRLDDRPPNQWFTSPEQGADHDAAIVTQQETLTPDAPAAAAAKAIPWAVIGIAAVIFYALVWKGE